MNLRSLEVIKDIYKPTKVTIVGGVEILESTSGNIVVKEKKDTDIRELYQYLASRSFHAFPPLIDDSRDAVNIFSYIPDTNMPKEQKISDFIKVIAALHQKTTFYKDVSSDEYKKIYESLSSQIDYLSFYYDGIYKEYFEKVYQSPREYLLLSNISKILASLNFARSELESWYEATKELNRFRVCQIHNNLCMDHFHKSEKDYILSWDKSRRDSPVMDLVKLYQCTYFDINFETILNEYLQICPWSKEEKKLFFITISLPPKFEEKGSEFTKVKNIRHMLDYVYKTENLIRPYYTTEQKK